jgi:hypothetical protein
VRSSSDGHSRGVVGHPLDWDGMSSVSKFIECCRA